MLNSNKRIFVVCFLKWISRCLFIHILEHLGYELIIETIALDKLPKDIRYSDLTQTNPQLLNYNFEDFDMVVVIVCNLPDIAKDFIIPQQLVDDLKQIIHIAEKQTSIPINLVGINGYLSNDFLEEQTEYFDGLFLGQGHNLATIQSFFEELENKD